MLHVKEALLLEFIQNTKQVSDFWTSEKHNERMSLHDNNSVQDWYEISARLGEKT